MHLFLLNPGSSVGPTFAPYYGTTHINDYSSLVWTERYRDYGEFQLNIPRNANNAQNIFWPGQLLGIQESNQVMLAETQRESVNDKGYVDLVVTGRSAECIIEDRVLWAPHGSEFTLAKVYDYLNTALLYLWQATQNNSTNDVGYTTARPAEISTNSKISNSILTDSASPGMIGTMPFFKVTVGLGQIGPFVRRYLNLGGLGLRCVRPPSNVAGIYGISVDPVNGANKGHITRTTLTGMTPNLRFDVYKGKDLTKYPPESGSMTFLSSEAGHLDNIDVATTYKEFVTNTVHVADATHWYPGTTSLPKYGDFFIRHRYVDASSMVNGIPNTEWDVMMTEAKKAYFQEHTNRAFLTADLTTKTPYQYGVHYYLGDQVMLTYRSRTRQAIVTEYTFVDDENGVREYPTFRDKDDLTAGVMNDW